MLFGRRSLNTAKYWQERVQVLSRDMINAKMRASGIQEKAAADAFNRWICVQARLDCFNVGTLSVEECRRVVAIIHSTKVGFKIRGCG